jgi:hypothetical protein
MNTGDCRFFEILVRHSPGGDAMPERGWGECAGIPADGVLTLLFFPEATDTSAFTYTYKSIYAYL